MHQTAVLKSAAWIERKPSKPRGLAKCPSSFQHCKEKQTVLKAKMEQNNSPVPTTVTNSDSPSK